MLLGCNVVVAVLCCCLGVSCCATMLGCNVVVAVLCCCLGVSCCATMLFFAVASKIPAA